MARTHNEIPAVARQRVLGAAAQRRVALSKLYPDLGASASYTRRTQEVSREISDGNAVVVQRKNALLATARLAMDVWDARAFAAIAEAAHNLDATSHESLESERQLAFDVAKTFYGVIAASNLVTATIHRHDAAVATVQEAKARLAAGLAARNEATRTELELAASELALTEAQANVDKARVALENVVGTSIGGRPVSAGSENDSFLDVIDRSKMEHIALARRLDLKAQEARVEEAEAKGQVPLLGTIPRVSVEGVFAASNEAGFAGREIDGHASVLLTWDLFDKGTRYAEADALAASLEIERLFTQALTRKIRAEVQDAFIDRAKAKSARKQAAARMKLAEANAAEVRELFTAGLATALERVDAVLSQFEAESELVQREVDLHLSGLAIIRASGGWPDSEEKSIP